MAPRQPGTRTPRLRGRRPATRSSLPRILILCEGARTEPGYFLALVRDLDLPSVSVRSPKRGQWGTAGITTTVQQERERDSDLDEIWCVLDHDERAVEIQGFREWLEQNSQGKRGRCENPRHHLDTLLRVLASAPLQLHEQALPRHARRTLCVRTGHPRAGKVSRRLSEGGRPDLRPLPRTHFHCNPQCKERPAIGRCVWSVIHRCMETGQQTSEAEDYDAKAGTGMKSGRSSDTRTEWRAVRSPNPIYPAGEACGQTGEVPEGGAPSGLDTIRPNDTVRREGG